jgi:hypothetical protein
LSDVNSTQERLRALGHNERMTPFQGIVLTLGFYSAVYASVAVL